MDDSGRDGSATEQGGHAPHSSPPSGSAGTSTGDSGRHPHNNHTKRNNQHSEEPRVIYLNDRHRNFPLASRPEASNYIRTTKYTPLTFVPKNLYEQFRRVTNMYFLVVAIISLTPFSPFDPAAVITALVVVLLLTAAKDAYEDYKRYQADKETNRRYARVLREVTAHDMVSAGDTHCTSTDGGHSHRFVEVLWQDVIVGDIVRVDKGDSFPADLLVLATSNQDGSCFIETSNLDGESYLKRRTALPATQQLGKAPAAVGRLRGTLTCDPPAPALYAFEGSLIIEPSSDKTAVGPSQLLLRGASLRHTAWITGLVVYSGHETKYMLNTTPPPSKRSTLERQLDRAVVLLLAVLAALCVVSAVLSGFWMAAHANAWYLDLQNDTVGTVPRAVLNVFTFVALYSSIVPISLYVTLEFVRIGQVWLMANDECMYDAASDARTKPRTSALNDEMGRIEYIFSDKTGTLTQNAMKFRMCSIAGIDPPYGKPPSENEREVSPGEESNGRKSDFEDERIAEALRRSAEGDNEATAVRLFFTALALCHTVIPVMRENKEDDEEEEEKDKGQPQAKEEEEEKETEQPREVEWGESGDKTEERIEYQGQSPDEIALVEAARDLGIVFLERRGNTVVLDDRTEGGRGRVVWEILHTNEFSSDRKRMSVVAKDPDGHIRLFLKGADSVVLGRVAHSTDAHGAGSTAGNNVVRTTKQHLHKFASLGLRTLCVAVADIEPDRFGEWSRRYQETVTSSEGVDKAERTARVNALVDELEQSLQLLGATAIEDKLAEGVPEAVATLLKAGIKVWVLTGDKTETAISVGYACNLLPSNGNGDDNNGLIVLHDIEGGPEGLQQAIEHALQKVREAKETADAPEYSLVIDGDKLQQAVASPNDNGTDDDETAAADTELRAQFRELAQECRSVIVSRATPLQKTLVVELVKHEGVTLAIGDGANDVAMLYAAHVGIGIMGAEGNQAVLASDVALPKFRYLPLLLLVHGRWNYIRTALLVCYFFYKNAVFAMVQFWFGIVNGWSGQTLYDAVMALVFNLVFTSLPIMVDGVLSRDVPARAVHEYPQLYADTRNGRGRPFSKRAFCFWLVLALIHSALLFWVPAYVLTAPSVRGGRTVDGLWELGTTVYTAIIVVVSFKLALEFHIWTAWHAVTLFGSVVLWFGFLAFYSSAAMFWLSPHIYGIAGILYSTPMFWFLLVWLTAAALIPDFFYKAAHRLWAPYNVHIIQENYKQRGLLSWRQGQTYKEGKEAKLPAEEQEPQETKYRHGKERKGEEFVLNRVDSRGSL